MAKNLVSSPILPPLAQMWAQKFFLSNSSLQDVSHYCKLSLYALSRKNNKQNLTKCQKTPSFRPDFSPCGPNSGRQICFKSLISSVTIYHGHLSSCTISQKTNDPISRKLSDGQTDGQADERV